MFQDQKNGFRSYSLHRDKWDEVAKDIEKLVNENGVLGDVSSSLSFKEQMKQDLIPRVWEMAEKEKEHLGWLIDNDAPTEMINKSSSSLSHLRQRHK